MNSALNLSEKLHWLAGTIYFFKKHLVVIGSLGLVAGLGRVIQLGGFGAISTWQHVALEVVIEAARLGVFLYVLGLASIRHGALRLKYLFTDRQRRLDHWAAARQKMRRQWFSILLNLVAFLGVAWGLNYLIDLLAYQTCLYLKLKQGGILAPTSSEWTILLFFKNLSTIPLTIAFNAAFLLWITNKFQLRPQA
ncbi:hypothetical protein GCM10027275_41380 [Rhabdobacter roseus]|uniref:Uncharacterized protein n=1 Tax=Rhabdobacter roseus TaxID=1655419 RepID=A0A840TS29_9BACT|nr:hypothetical protein [Rhabdobacter roseus]MBB5286114.1 hypothetical protein [Rhabdobacter roseus]